MLIADPYVCEYRYLSSDVGTVGLAHHTYELLHEMHELKRQRRRDAFMAWLENYGEDAAIAKFGGECFGDPSCTHGQIECRYRHRHHRASECGILLPAFESAHEGVQMGLFQ